jgi:hypothetical protein
MSNVVSSADARPCAGLVSIFDDAQDMIAAYGRRAGLIAAICAKMPTTPEPEREYWNSLGEEIERLQGYGWYVPGPGELGAPDSLTA